MCFSITWLTFSRFLSLLESYCLSNSLIIDINDDFPLFASWFEMCKALFSNINAIFWERFKV